MTIVFHIILIISMLTLKKFMLFLFNLLTNMFAYFYDSVHNTYIVRRYDLKTFWSYKSRGIQPFMPLLKFFDSEVYFVVAWYDDEQFNIKFFGDYSSALNFSHSLDTLKKSVFHHPRCLSRMFRIVSPRLKTSKIFPIL